ncbi:D-alanyl-D-alanine carboxypeptidase [Candidatus Falkowbacteria bacterium]|nr:D-alanyl-D-alanine carboxypeptidase [Candidatus Falkowbacteria bacterium]
MPGRLAAIANTNLLSEPDDQESAIVENGKMLKTPAKNVVYIGDKINTKIDAYLIADYQTNKILAGKNVDFVRPMASFTKIMTAYRLMSEGLKLYSATTYNSKLKAKSGSFRAVNGEIFNNKDLMCALLVSSMNTPARMLVSAVDKSETKFIARMNKQAKDWGLKKTKFTDTYGYDLGNVTTARDFLTLYKNVERVGDIRQVLGAKDYVYNEINDLDGKPKHFDSHSNLLVSKPGLPFKIISSKTGYLDESGAGLAMLIERPSDGKQFIIITMGNPDYKNRFVEPEKIANFTITNF